MCLTINKDSEVKKATKDIVCYKWVIENKEFDTSGCKSGDDFIAFIHNDKVTGKISIKNNSLYLCNNLKKGNECENKQGYKYSWAEYANISHLTINENPIAQISILKTPYRSMTVKVGEQYDSNLTVRCNNNKVSQGFHSFATKKGALSASYGEILIKCIIPKGAEYIKGFFCDEICYASNKVKYVEQIIPKP